MPLYMMTGNFEVFLYTSPVVILVKYMMGRTCSLDEVDKTYVYKFYREYICFKDREVDWKMIARLEVGFKGQTRT